MKSDDFGRRPVGPNPTLYFFRKKNTSLYEDVSKKERMFMVLVLGLIAAVCFYFMGALTTNKK